MSKKTKIAAIKYAMMLLLINANMENANTLPIKPVTVSVKSDALNFFFSSGNMRLN
jgi:hypothetical protein